MEQRRKTPEKMKEYGKSVKRVEPKRPEPSRAIFVPKFIRTPPTFCG